MAALWHADKTQARVFAAAAFAVFGAWVAAEALWKGGLSVFPFHGAHLLFSYESGFLKRGLVGELLRQLGVNAGPRIAPGVALTISTTFVLAWVLYSIWALRDWSARERIRVYALLVTCPALFSFTAVSLGSLDHVTGILGLGSLMLLTRRGAVRWLAVLLCALGVLTHEAFVMLQGGVVLAASAFAEARRGDGSPWLPLSLFLTMVVALVAVQIQVVDPSIVSRRLIRAGFPTDRAVWYAQIFVRGVDDNVALTLRRYDSWRICGLVFLAPWVAAHGYLMMRVVRSGEGGPPGDRWRRVLMLAPLSILPLFILGRDTFRWVASGVLASLSVMLFAGRFELADQSRRLPVRLALTLAGIGAIAGPMTSNAPLAVWSRLLRSFF